MKGIVYTEFGPPDVHQGGNLFRRHHFHRLQSFLYIHRILGHLSTNMNHQYIRV